MSDVRFTDTAPEAFGRELRHVIARRFPAFGLGWLGVTALWILMLAVESEIDGRAAVALFVFQALVVGAVVLLQRRDPSAAWIPWGTVAALAALGLAWLAFFLVHGEKALLIESLLITLCAVAGVIFALGWRRELALVGATLGPTLFTGSWLVHLTPRFQSTALLAFASAVCVGVAESSHRRLWAMFRHRDAEERARRALGASRDAYRALAESAPDHIWTIDLEGRLTYVNEAAARFRGMQASELVGQPFDPLIADWLDAPGMTEALARLAAGERLPALIVQVDGAEGAVPRRRWLESVITPLHGPDGKLAGMRGISRDVTERVLAEQRLRASEERFRLAFANTSVGMSITDLEGRPVQINQAICDFLGYDQAELMELSIAEVTHPDDRAPTVAARERLVRGEADAVEIEKRFVRKDGAVVWGHVTISLERDAAGAPRCFVALVQDVTQRRQAMDALRASEEKLRRLALGQAAIREEERKKLGFDLHDDVCQELVGIGILVAAARRRIGPESAGYEELGRGIGYINEVVEYLRKVARELRPLHLRDFGLEGSLRSLAEGLSSAETEVSVHFPTRIPRLDEETEVAAYRIAQEAITNALRHGRAQRVEVTLSAGADELHLEVRDDGVGFDVNDGRADLGLLGIEARALALGGSAEVRSSVGEGTTVVLRCPIVVAAPLRERAS